MLDLHVLTGFLGSGKTTLLRAYLARPEAAGTAVIVNEAGEIGLDGALLREGRDGLRMAMLDNGCVCCAQGGELATTIETLLDSLDAAPARIVLETSGLAKPGAVLRGLQVRPTIPLRAGIVSTFDALRHGEIAAFEEAAAQWAGAQTLVLTRLDQCADRNAAMAAARGVNPLAGVIAEPDRGAALAEAFARRAGPPALPVDSDVPHPRIAVLRGEQTGALGWEDVAAWLDEVAMVLGERLLRIKGVLRCEAARGVLVQAVGTLFSPPRGFPLEGAGFLTLIVRDASVREIPDLAGLEIVAPSPFRRTGARNMTSI